MPNAQFNLLKTRRFLPLFITQFLGAFNDNVFKNAFVILITYRLAMLAGWNAQVLVTVAAGIFILPFFLFSAVAGELADKYEKSRLIFIIKLIEIGLMILAAIGFYLQSTSLLFMILFALGTHSTFFGPLKYAILPEHLQPNELIAGNGMIEAGTFLAILLGTLFGGILILLPYGEYIISASVILIALIGWCSSRFIPFAKSHTPDLPIHHNWIKKTFLLIRYSSKQKEIFLFILGISWFWLVGATFLAELPVFAKDALHANEHVVTFFLMLFSIGLGLGSLVCNKLLKGQLRTTYVPIGALGISLFTIDLYFASFHFHQPLSFLFGLIPFLKTFQGWRITIDLLAIAVCGGLYTVPLYAMLQYKSEASHRARIIASNNILNALFMVIAALLTLFMLKFHFSIPEVFITVGIGNALMAIYLSYGLNKISQL